MKMTELKDWLNSINFNKDDLTSDDPDTIKIILLILSTDA